MTWGWTSVTPADVLNILWNALESSISLQLAGTYSVLAFLHADSIAKELPCSMD
ncbi:hypothetical protein LguiA_011665 [Lonicera macranthoides]